MPSRLFSFMNPLAVEIWLSMLGAYVMVSLAIWIVARFSPYEWVEPRACPSCKCPLQVGSRRVVHVDRVIGSTGCWENLERIFGAGLPNGKKNL
ncbi:glutamate receptor ionotropic, kainate 4-like [Ptiloglossa arizonensis]|uniref:glutamate receptor ionotropic, kainate 4-like n=1 Tax=Ptiloglossa arizonensis TaxID=3350558 RepID=UPI003FA13A65